MSSPKEGAHADGSHVETVSIHEKRIPSRDGMPTIPPGQNTALDVAAFELRKIDLRTILGAVALALTYESCILSFALPSAVLLTINADIGPSSQIVWGPTAWSLAAAVVQTIAGRCSDIFGRRNFILTGNLLGLVGCIVACRAQSVPGIIGGMTLTGVASGTQLLAFACAGEIVPKKWRGQTLAAMNFAALPGSCFGSVIAYALVDKLNWRWTFYVGIMANSIALVATAIFYWPPGFLGLHPEGKTRWQQFKEIDFVGLILYAGGLTLFLLGVSWGNNPYPWTSAHVLAPLLLGAVCCIAVLPAWEAYSTLTMTKLFPPYIFKNVRGFCLPLYVSFASGMLLIGLPVFWPQQIQLLFTTVPRTVGWYSLAFGCPSVIGAALGGYSWSKFKHTRIQFTTMTAMMTIFMASVASTTPYTPARAIVLFSFTAAFVGATCLVGILVLQFGAPDGDIGVATGLMGTSRAAGGAVAIAMFGSIIRNTVTADLAPELLAAVTMAGLPSSQLEAFIVAFASGSFAALETIDGVTPAVLAAAETASKNVYSKAFMLVYLVTLAFGVPAVIAAALSPSCDAKLTNQVSVRLDAPHLLGHGKGEAKALHTLEQKENL